MKKTIFFLFFSVILIAVGQAQQERVLYLNIWKYSKGYGQCFNTTENDGIVVKVNGLQIADNIGLSNTAHKFPNNKVKIHDAVPLTMPLDIEISKSSKKCSYLFSIEADWWKDASVSGSYDKMFKHNSQDEFRISFSWESTPTQKIEALKEQKRLAAAQIKEDERLLNLSAPTYIRPTKIKYTCDREGSECEARYSVKIGDSKTKKGVFGTNGKDMQKGTSYNKMGDFKNLTNGELYIGDFKRKDEIKILFDVWENDRGGSYEYNSGGAFYEDDDDDHPDVGGTAVIGKLGRNYNVTFTGCPEITFEIYHKDPEQK